MMSQWQQAPHVDVGAKTKQPTKIKLATKRERKMIVGNKRRRMIAHIAKSSDACAPPTHTPHDKCF